jgi:hypothetical protein
VRNTNMNTVLSTRVDEEKNNHPPARVQLARERRVGLADRVALHLGLALITWSRRSRRVAPRPSPDRLRSRREAALAQAARECEWQRAVSLGQPRR